MIQQKRTEHTPRLVIKYPLPTLAVFAHNLHQHPQLSHPNCVIARRLLAEAAEEGQFDTSGQFKGVVFEGNLIDVLISRKHVVFVEDEVLFLEFVHSCGIDITDHDVCELPEQIAKT